MLILKVTWILSGPNSCLGAQANCWCQAFVMKTVWSSNWAFCSIWAYLLHLSLSAPFEPVCSNWAYDSKGSRPFSPNLGYIKLLLNHTFVFVALLKAFIQRSVSLSQGHQVLDEWSWCGDTQARRIIAITFISSHCVLSTLCPYIIK